MKRGRVIVGVAVVFVAAAAEDAVAGWDGGGEDGPR